MKLLVSHSPLVISLICLSAAACRMHLVNNRRLAPLEAPRPVLAALSDRFFYFSWVRVHEAAAEDPASASLKKRPSSRGGLQKCMHY